MRTTTVAAGSSLSEAARLASSSYWIPLTLGDEGMHYPSTIGGFTTSGLSSKGCTLCIRSTPARADLRRRSASAVVVVSSTFRTRSILREKHMYRSAIRARGRSAHALLPPPRSPGGGPISEVNPLLLLCPVRAIPEIGLQYVCLDPSLATTHGTHDRREASKVRCELPPNWREPMEQSRSTELDPFGKGVLGASKFERVEVMAPLQRRP